MATSFLARSAALTMILGSSILPAFPAFAQEPSQRPSTPKETIILNTADVPPFHYVRDGKVVGLVPPVIDCALDKMKQPYQVRVLPLKRAQNEVAEGIAQGFFSTNRSKTRDQYAKASDPVGYKIWNWYVRKDIDLKPTDPEFKKTVPIGVLAGTDDAAELKAKGYQTVPLKTSKQIAQMLDAKRIGAARMIDVTMKDAVNETGGNLNDFNTYFSSAYPTSAYFGNVFLKKNPGFLREFDQSVAECFNPRKESPSS